MSLASLFFDTAMRMRSYCSGPLKLKLLGRAGASSIVTSQILAMELSRSGPAPVLRVAIDVRLLRATLRAASVLAAADSSAVDRSNHSAGRCVVRVFPVEHDHICLPFVAQRIALNEVVG